MILAFLIAIVLPIIVAQRSREIEGFTEFYLQDNFGRASSFPDEILVDELFTIITGITNHEGRTVEYSVIVKYGDQIISSVPFLSISNGESWNHPVEISIPNAGNQQIIEFILIRQGYPSPYRNLHIFVDVKPADVNN